MRTQTHSDRAIEAAVKALGPTNPRTAALLLFLAAARHMGAILDEPETAAEFAYMAADELATGVVR